MKTGLLLGLFLFIGAAVIAQKKPLDPTVYDGWENIAEKLLSPDGKYLVYTITPQEGDGRLVIRATGSSYAKEIPRGADATVTADGRFVVFRIRPYFKDIREARIKKKTPDQSPKDSLAWIELGTDDLTKIPRVKSYKLPELEGDWLAYLKEKPIPPVAAPHADSAKAPARPEPQQPLPAKQAQGPATDPAPSRMPNPKKAPTWSFAISLPKKNTNSPWSANMN
jgi:hypothetical protein